MLRERVLCHNYVYLCNKFHNFLRVALEVSFRFRFRYVNVFAYFVTPIGKVLFECALMDYRQLCGGFGN